MSTSNAAPITRRVRAYFAPVNRAAGTPVVFDPSLAGGFDLGQPPAPWIDLGWIAGFTRKSLSTVAAVQTGAPAVTKTQVRGTMDAHVSFRFLNWGKLPMALSCGSEHMNLLAPASGAAANGSGAKAAAAVALGLGSTATSLVLDNGTSAFQAGQIVAVDADYQGQTGFVGAPVAGAWVSSAAAVGNDADYVRRVTFNVARVASASANGLTLAQPLIAGTPLPGMKVQAVLGFVDREGGSFFHEWSALFAIEGEQGDRIFYHYPRLQAMGNAQEAAEVLTGPLERVCLAAQFRALPVTDGNDGSQALCFRSFLPGAQTLV